MKIAIACLGVSALALGACQMDSDKTKSSVGEDARPTHALGMEGEEEVPLAEVPAAVKSAALAALPGLVLDSAEAEVEDGVLIYALSGTDDEGALEVDVTADGQVLKVERGEDDEDQPGDDDDDDDGDDDDGDDGEDGDDDEQSIPLDQVPALVLQAALKAVPGLIVEEAELEVEDEVTVYGLAGTAGGKEVEVEVSAEGQVLEVEWEEDD
jgi:uncharacterized membrane protein YkoI